MEALTVQDLVAEAKKDVVEIEVSKVPGILAEAAALLIDVREADEYQQGYIKGALNIPRGVLEFRTSLSYPGAVAELASKSTPIILYCRSGARSALAAKALGLLGYKSVVSMAGGFLAWEVAQLPTEK